MFEIEYDAHPFNVFNTFTIVIILFYSIFIVIIFLIHCTSNIVKQKEKSNEIIVPIPPRMDPRKIG